MLLIVWKLLRFYNFSTSEPLSKPHIQGFRQHLKFRMCTYVYWLNIATNVTENYLQTKIEDRMIRNRLLQVVNSTDKRVVDSSLPPGNFLTVQRHSVIHDLWSQSTGLWQPFGAIVRTFQRMVLPSYSRNWTTIEYNILASCKIKSYCIIPFVRMSCHSLGSCVVLARIIDRTNVTAILRCSSFPNNTDNRCKTLYSTTATQCCAD